MLSVTPALKNYIVSAILPQYQDENSGHGLSHIQYVIRRSLRFAEQIGSLNADMVYAIAVFHDLGHSINPAHHELLSAELFRADCFMQIFFTKQQQSTIAEAIEDHRASKTGMPRSIYGKVISTADRSTDAAELLKRTHAYSVMHEPNLSFASHAERAYIHIQEKYGQNGYANSYFPDDDYEKFKAEIQKLLGNYALFLKTYTSLNQK